MTQPEDYGLEITRLLVLSLLRMHEFLSETHELPLTETNTSTATSGTHLTSPVSYIRNSSSRCSPLSNSLYLQNNGD